MRKGILFLSIMMMGTMLCACTNKASGVSSSVTENSSTEESATEWTLPADYRSWMEEIPSVAEFGGKSYDLVTTDTDRILYRDYDSLYEASELIVIGEFVADATQTIQTRYDANLECDVIYDGTASNTFKIEKVLKGDIESGATITISQRYIVDEDKSQIISFSRLTPMEKGTKWIYCLMPYSKESESYWTAGDYTGRYPYKEIVYEDYVDDKYSANDLGILQRGLFYGTYNIYKTLVEKNNIVFE